MGCDETGVRCYGHSLRGRREPSLPGGRPDDRRPGLIRAEALDGELRPPVTWWPADDRRAGLGRGAGGGPGSRGGGVMLTEAAARDGPPPLPDATLHNGDFRRLATGVLKRESMRRGGRPSASGTSPASIRAMFVRISEAGRLPSARARSPTWAGRGSPFGWRACPANGNRGDRSCCS